MIRYRINKKTMLYIENNVIHKIKKYCQKHAMNESGGILLGKVKNNYSEIIIVDVSEPCSRDENGRCYFIRNKENAQIIIDEKWRESNGEVNYIGEWHTHPEITPKPSLTDKKLLSECIKNNECPFNLLFMIIVGSEGDLYVGYQKILMRKQKQLKMPKKY